MYNVVFIGVILCSIGILTQHVASSVSDSSSVSALTMAALCDIKTTLDPVQWQGTYDPCDANTTVNNPCPSGGIYGIDCNFGGDEVTKM